MTPGFLGRSFRLAAAAPRRLLWVVCVEWYGLVWYGMACMAGQMHVEMNSANCRTGRLSCRRICKPHHEVQLCVSYVFFSKHVYSDTLT
ncbi:hypothetical protein F4680DRAFT_429698 [Xylaria scruposa]|nr:hypothetical protein F4680DRAFT_429698 [Xylaria scruposa]